VYTLKTLRSLFRTRPGLTGRYRCDRCGLTCTAEGEAEFVGRVLHLMSEHNCSPATKTLK
jgi:hypothetical protein